MNIITEIHNWAIHYLKKFYAEILGFSGIRLHQQAVSRLDILGSKTELKTVLLNELKATFAWVVKSQL